MRARIRSGCGQHRQRPEQRDIGEALAKWAIGGAEPAKAEPEAHLIKDVTEEEKTKDGKKVIVYTVHTASGATLNAYSANRIRY